jgi:hypothetical protein
MSTNPTVLHILERKRGRKILVVINRNYGFEDVISTVSQEPPGIWLSDAEAVVMRTTLANPLPQIVSREDRSELFINLNDIQRIEVLH